MNKFKIILSLFLSFGLLTACASNPDPMEENLSAEQLYSKAEKRLKKDQYARAAEYYERVELEHPYSKWAVKAKIMGAYAYYQDKKYDDAILALDRFIKFHPGNEEIDYAYYMKAMCYYEQISDVRKDQSNTEHALESLYQVTTRFPNSKYAKDAALKIDLANDHLAGKEMEVGRYYLSQQNYLSALNRFSAVVNEYQTTSHIEEALYRQIEVYKILGLDKEANNAFKVLNYNYPKSKWTEKAQSLVKG